MNEKIAREDRNWMRTPSIDIDRSEATVVTTFEQQHFEDTAYRTMALSLLNYFVLDVQVKHMRPLD